MRLSTGRQLKHRRSTGRLGVTPLHRVRDWTSAGVSIGDAFAEQRIAPPAWVRVWTASGTSRRLVGGLPVLVASGANASLVTVFVPEAAALAADQFEQCAHDVYQAIRSVLETMPHGAPVRFWNHLPGIHAPIDELRDRYMVFNAGRFKAMSDWFGGATCFPGRLPAASGVGHHGDELVVHCLACARSGQAVENPRQVPAFRYSRRYGPLPPCFSRATIISDPCNGRNAMLIAGTASIVGEQSAHPGDLERQLEETFANLRWLLATVQGAGKHWRFTDLRAYYLRQNDGATIERLIRRTLGTAVKVQMVHAELCREELLVEIEGLASQDAGTQDDGARP